MAHNFTKAVAAAAIVMASLVVAPVNLRGDQAVKDPAALAALAKEADTPREHAAVAKEYRLRAEAFEAEAATHEAEARRLHQQRSSMSYKWPAMARNGWERQSHLAVQARRAAQECYAQAARHVGLAVEGQNDVD